MTILSESPTPALPAAVHASRCGNPDDSSSYWHEAPPLDPRLPKNERYADEMPGIRPDRLDS